MLIKWNDIHSVNVKELDQQHKKLVEIINKLFKIQASEADDLRAVIKELVNYADYHLATEEKHFLELQYDQGGVHKKIHDYYRGIVQDFESQFLVASSVETREEISQSLRRFLQDWWIQHINNVDQEYSDFFNAHGLF